MRLASGRRLTLLLGVLATISIVLLAVENHNLRTARTPGVPVPAAPHVGPGDPLPDVSVVEIAPALARATSRSTLREEVKDIGLVFFFTTRCPYCQQSWSYVDQLAAELEVDTVGVIGVALDGQDGHGELIATVPLQRVVAPVDVRSAVRIDVPTVPTMLLVGADDTIRGVWRGVVTEALAEEIWLATQELLSRAR